MTNELTSAVVTTSRLATRVLQAGERDGETVLFLHGNVSSADWWRPVLTGLPDGYRVIAPDLRGYGHSAPDSHLDATKGMADHADDLITLVDHLGAGRFHVVGSSLGGVVVWWLMGDHAERLLSVTQAAPGSPYGFGATQGSDGRPVNEDYAGSGGGLVNPEFVERIGLGDHTTESPLSPLSALRLLTAGVIDPDIETLLLEALLETHLGEKDYPGDVETSANWPFVAPGKWGSTNALSPKYLGGLTDRVLSQPNKPPVLWIRGDADIAVSDSAVSDPGTWGPLDLIPGYPGADDFPPQPMLAQTRAFLDSYAKKGGSYHEVVIEDCGHLPYVEKPQEFVTLLGEHLSEKDPGEETL